MKEWMRKHHGYQPGTLPMHQNFTSYSTSDTPISQAHKTVSRSHDSCWISTHWTYHKFFSFFFLFSLSSSSRNSKNVSVPLFLLLISSISHLYVFLHYCSLFLLFLYYSSPTILHLTPYHINPLNHPPPPHPQNHPFHCLHPHHSSLG